MRFTVLTLFPELFGPFSRTSLLGKAIGDDRVELELVDFRTYATDRHRSVDDTPFGGGAGMILKPEPLAAAIDSVVGADPGARKILLTPQGVPMDQRTAVRLSGYDHLVLICGRYEGVDERIREFCADEEISLGDFVLAGGEVAAMAVIEAVCRLLPGVVGNQASVVDESFADCCLEYPQYTRPREFRGRAVPQVLLDGDHAAIARWRRTQALQRTAARRPDLLSKLRLSDEDRGLVQQVSGPDAARANVGRLLRCDPVELAARTYVALLHHPVLDRQGKVVSTALTNLDLHDIARACRTFGLGAYFVVTPVERQQALALRIKKHWTDGYGGESQANRRQALERVRVADSLESAVEMVAGLHDGAAAVTVATSAQVRGRPVLSAESLLCEPELAARPVVLVFGTGWGLVPEVIEKASFCLEPITGLDTYNHLSVRSAVSIYLDRLFGRTGTGPNDAAGGEARGDQEV